MTRLPLWVKDDGTVYGLLTMMTRLVISSSLSVSLSLEGSIVYIYIYIYISWDIYTGLFCESK